MMWALSPMPSCVPRPNYFKPPPEKCFALAVVSIKFQRRPPSQSDHNNNSDAQDNIGRGLGGTVLAAALKSNPQTPQNSNSSSSSSSSIKISNSKKKQQLIRKEEEEERQQLSGSDVLLALQRATAQKIKNKKKKKKRSDYPSSYSSVGKNRVTEEEREESEEETLDNSKAARPISIKSEWATRLDALEKRLQELIVDTNINT